MRTEKERQDHFFKKAKRQKYLSRSVYKLEEIQGKYNFIRRGDRVLDLGCAPGSWLHYVAETVGPQGLVVGVDIKKVEKQIATQVIIINKDVNELDAELLLKYCSGYNVVLSDMAPPTTGIGFVDSTRSIALADRVLEIAGIVSKKGGHFLCKVFEGEDFPQFLKKVKSKYEWVKIIKPQASRKKSREIYLLGMGIAH